MTAFTQLDNKDVAVKMRAPGRTAIQAAIQVSPCCLGTRMSGQAENLDHVDVSRTPPVITPAALRRRARRGMIR